jgi:hypothetical protein
VAHGQQFDDVFVEKPAFQQRQSGGVEVLFSTAVEGGKIVLNYIR